MSATDYTAPPPDWPAAMREARERVEAERDIGADWPDALPLPQSGDIGDGAADYPLDALPAALRAAAAEVARFAKVPAASPAVVGLSVIATAIGKRAVIEERIGLEHHPALFFVEVAASGERKSPSFRLMTGPLDTWIDARAADYEAERARTIGNHAVIDAAVAGKKQAAKRDGADLQTLQDEIAELERKRLPMPAHPRMFTSDVTEERLFQRMHEHAGAYAVMSGEGRQIIDAIAGKYSGEGRTGDGIYLAGTSGDTITRDRVGGPNGPEDRIIIRPCLNVCIMVQPDKYHEAAAHPALRASGALARIWPVFLPSLVGSRIEHEHEAGLDRARLEGYAAKVRALLDAKLPAGQDGPHRASLSPEAAAARRTLHNDIERLMGREGELADVRDIAAKAVSATCKLALVLHLFDSPERLLDADSLIGITTWNAAACIGLYHLSEAVRVQRRADDGGTLELARRILAWLRTAERREVTATAVAQFLPRPRPKAREAGEALELLADAYGWLRVKAGTTARKPVYEVSPALFRAEATTTTGHAPERESRIQTLAILATAARERAAGGQTAGEASQTSHASRSQRVKVTL